VGLTTVQYDMSDERIPKLGMIYFTCGNWSSPVIPKPEPATEEDSDVSPEPVDQETQVDDTVDNENDL